MGVTNFDTVGAALGASLRADANRRYVFERFDAPFTVHDDDGDGSPTGVAGDVNLLRTSRNLFTYTVLGTQTILFPTYDNVNGGLDVSQDLVDNDGAEYGLGVATNPAHRGRMVVGTDEFFFRVKARVGDVSETDEFLIGYRKAEAHQATYTSYADYALLGLDNASGNVFSRFLSAVGGTGTVATLKAWADGETHTLEVRISSSGKGTLLYDGAVLASSVQNPVPHTAALAMVPIIRYRNATGDATPDPDIQILEWESGTFTSRGIIAPEDVDN